MVQRSKAKQSNAKHGKARHVMAWHGTARHGTACDHEVTCCTMLSYRTVVTPSC